MNISLSAFAPENLVSRDGFGSPVPRQPAHLHTQAESGAYLRDSSRVPRRRPFIYLNAPYAIGSVPSLSGHAIAYTDGVHCREFAGTGPVNFKVVPNECWLGRSPWTNYYAPLFLTPTIIGMRKNKKGKNIMCVENAQNIIFNNLMPPGIESGGLVPLVVPGSATGYREKGVKFNNNNVGPTQCSAWALSKSQPRFLVLIIVQFFCTFSSHERAGNR